MKISTKGRYALTIMQNLGQKYDSGEFLSLTEISKKENISLKYLEKIMISLKKADFFIVAKGKEGGYKLKRNPQEYTIGEIVRAADEELDIIQCIKGNHTCPAKNKCKSFPLWKELSEEINHFLDNKRLIDYL